MTVFTATAMTISNCGDIPGDNKEDGDNVNSISGSSGSHATSIQNIVPATGSLLIDLPPAMTGTS